jgi:glutamate synthase (NADPH/NADH)
MGLNLEELYGKDISEEQAPHEYSQYQPEKGYGWANALPERQGLYDPEYEKDACGVGFAAHIKGKPSHKIVSDGECQFSAL